MQPHLFGWNHLNAALLLFGSVLLLTAGCWLATHLLGGGIGLWFLGVTGLLLAGLVGNALDGSYGERNRDQYWGDPKE